MQPLQRTVGGNWGAPKNAQKDIAPTEAPVRANVSKPVSAFMAPASATRAVGLHPFLPPPPRRCLQCPAIMQRGSHLHMQLRPLQNSVCLKAGSRTVLRRLLWLKRCRKQTVHQPAPQASGADSKHGKPRQRQGPGGARRPAGHGGRDGLCDRWGAPACVPMAPRARLSLAKRGR